MIVKLIKDPSRLLVKPKQIWRKHGEQIVKWSGIAISFSVGVWFFKQNYSIYKLEKEYEDTKDNVEIACMPLDMKINQINHKLIKQTHKSLHNNPYLKLHHIVGRDAKSLDEFCQSEKEHFALHKDQNTDSMDKDHQTRLRLLRCWQIAKELQNGDDKNITKEQLIDKMEQEKIIYNQTQDKIADSDVQKEIVEKFKQLHDDQKQFTKEKTCKIKFDLQPINRNQYGVPGMIIEYDENKDKYVYKGAGDKRTDYNLPTDDKNAITTHYYVDHFEYNTEDEGTDKIKLGVKGHCTAKEALMIRVKGLGQKAVGQLEQNITT